MSSNSTTIKTKSTYETIKSSTIKNTSYITNKYRNYQKFIFLLISCGIILLLLRYIFKDDGFDFLKEYQLLRTLFLFFIGIFFFGILYYTFKLSERDENRRNGKIPEGYIPDNNINILPFVKFTTYFLLGLICILLICYGLAKGFETYPDAISVVTSTLLILIVAVGLYGLYIYIKSRKKVKSLPTQPGVLRFFQNITLYTILCMFSDIRNFIIEEYKKAPKEVWTILIIEIILIALYFLSSYFRKIILFIFCNDAMKLLNEPIYLDSEKEIASAQYLYGSDLDDSNYIYNYSIVFWFYLNPTANDDEYYTILNYNKKPIVEYNQHQNKLRVKMNIGREKETLIYLDNSIESQKWNQMVINYQSNTLDIFINNTLVSTNSYRDMPLMSYDSIRVGENDGIQGGICNVMYFKRNIPKHTINLLYYLCKYENPPIL